MELLALVLVLSVTAGAVCGRLAAGWLLSSRQRDDPPPAEEAHGSWLDGVTRRRVLVHTRDGQTIDGQLARVDRDGVVLAPATLADGPHDLAGEVFVPQERIAWLQQPEAASSSD